MEYSNLPDPDENPSAALSEGYRRRLGDYEASCLLANAGKESRRIKARKAFYRDLAKAQRYPPRITKSQTTSFANKSGRQSIGYKYEDLAEVTSIVLPWLADYGFSVRWDILQPTPGKGEHVTVVCYLNHRAGHEEHTAISSVPDGSGGMNIIQKIGSTLTYLRRYTLLAITGLAADKEDDDGAGAGRRPPATITADQASDIADGIAKSGRNAAKFCRYFGIDEITDLPTSKLDTARSMLQRAMAKIDQDREELLARANASIQHDASEIPDSDESSEAAEVEIQSFDVDPPEEGEK